ncbi:MAG: B12-binding domain-containing radical SAM protein [Oligoflexia bacterium]|nr:B12-binding domain-containing radical SAM protein [Oligoflexia bacterium]
MNAGSSLKFAIIYPPLRNQADIFPPYGCLSIINALTAVGVQVDFMNLDYDRKLLLKDVLLRIKETLPDVIGISAVTSTTYAFIKELIFEVKKNISKKIIFIVGGNIVSNAEVLIGKAGVDICFIGESYYTIQEFVKCFDGKTLLPDELSKVKGLVFERNKELFYSGRRSLEDINTIPLIRNFDLLDTDHYFPLINKQDFRNYPEQMQRKIERLPSGKRRAIVLIGSGCQNACTFCHRNVRGIRQRSIDAAFEYLDELIKKYDLGLIHFGDESFFFKEDWLKSFTEEISKRKICFGFSGVRADMVVKYQKYVQEMAENAGLIDIAIGLESGSQKMLDIMNKNISVEVNEMAIDIVNGLNIYHTPQIILGMPGDGPREIVQSQKIIERCKSNSGLASINVAQVLPGTPLYWFAMKNRLIQDEEAYLLSISNKNAFDLSGTISVSEYPIQIYAVARHRLWINSQMKKTQFRAVASASKGFLKFLFEITKSPRISRRDKISILCYAFLGKTFKTRPFAFDIRPLNRMMNEDIRKNISENGVEAIKYGHQ